MKVRFTLEVEKNIETRIPSDRLMNNLNDVYFRKIQSVYFKVEAENEPWRFHNECSGLMRY